MLARFLLPLLLLAASFKLYLKDGSWQLVSEYKVEQDRVRYYSVERSDWEEIPLELADLKRTGKEIQDRQARDKEEARLIEEEDKAEREARREVARVPEDAGVFFADGGEIRPLKQAEIKVNNDKRRSILKVLTPLPVITGKATVEIDGETSAFAVHTELPEFYFRLSQPQRFGIIKLTPGKGIRVVEKITIIPVSKEMVEEPQPVEIFRRQVGENLYKVWPMEALAPGEYAAVEYTEGKVNLQVWDFAYKPKK
ncbi:MAG: hypothetical protein HY235_00350 [Acidobacteria bacterium]|nr:hypothetical protein [Acidobacteriota bacterium]